MNKPETATTIRPNNNTGNWTPNIGHETKSLLKHLNLSEESSANLLKETSQIFSLCGNPTNHHNKEIGLVFGYIQSGKTMSFTTLTALAKDNGYRIIIIIAGISTNLVDQSFTRLERDLRIDTRSDLQWLSFKNPRREDITKRNQIANALSEWKDETFPSEERKTILITVMKQRNHLPNLTELLTSLDLENVPTLIIDDEGDQASMNTRARANVRTGEDEISSIHAKIVALKNGLPHHTFIQYTATPQANLFIDIMDNLSPNFIQLLTPGEDYTGGKSFFVENGNLVETITDINPDEVQTSPPGSLLRAMQIFFLGVVKGSPKREGKKRSMMIHPSQLTFTHVDYSNWVTAIKNNWIDILSMNDSAPDKIDLLSEFQEAYNDLARTVQDLPTFAELSGHRLRHAINGTVVQSLNSRRENTTIVNWRNSYSFILIGGQAMDRGFTVEGLTVTYMPRTVGVGNADTIQQRARFFGYKGSYLGYCRVYLDEGARDAYIDYIEHEEDMRRRLIEHNMTGKILNNWPREVFLSLDLNLTRRNVISHDLERSVFGEDWFRIKSPHHSEYVIKNNQSTIKTFIDSITFDNTGRIPVFHASLADIYDGLLNQLRYTSDEDAKDYSSLLYILSNHLEEHPEEESSVFLMSDFESPRERSLTADNTVNQLFQGPNANYPGDINVLGGRVTIQIHVLNLLENNTIKYSGVPALAIKLPEDMAKSIIRWAD